MKRELLAVAISTAITTSLVALPSIGAPAPAPPTAVSPVPTFAVPPPSACCRVVAGTVVTIELAEPVSTKKQVRGDNFPVRLAEPLVVDGRTLVPAGATGFGEVVDAAAGGIGGRPAKLVLAVRYIDYDGVRIALHGFRLGGGGHDNANVAIPLSATPYVGLLAIAIPGGDVVYPAGTRASAKVTAEVVIPLPAPTPASPQSPSMPTQGALP